MERSPAGAGSWARGGGVQVDTEPGCCPQLTLSMPHPLWRHLPLLVNLQVLPSEPRARQCGPRLDSGGRHSTDSRHFAMTSIRGSAFSEVSMTGLGERVTGGRVRAAPVSALGGGSQAARAGTTALLCSSCTRVCTHADMHTRTLRPLHTFVKIRVRPVNQHNMVAGSRAPLLFMHHFKNRCLGWVHMQGYWNARIRPCPCPHALTHTFTHPQLRSRARTPAHVCAHTQTRECARNTYAHRDTIHDWPRRTLRPPVCGRL